MGKTIAVMPNQSMMDIIIQATGSLEAGIQFCGDNGVSVSDILVVGTVYEVSDPASGLGDDSALKYLRDNGIVIGTYGDEDVPVPPPGPSLTMQVVLKPVMAATVINPSILPSVSRYYDFRLTESTPYFIYVHGLDAAYVSVNDVHFEEETNWLSGHPSGLTSEISHNPATAMYVFWHIPWSGGASLMMCWWYGDAPHTSTVSPVTFKDTVGNTAYLAPVIIFDTLTNTLIGYLIGDVDVEFVSSTDTTCTLRVTRSHSYIPPGPLNDFRTYSLGWIGMTGAVPDPAHPGDDDVRLITVGPGAHTFGVTTTYTNPVLHHDYPVSAMTCVVEVTT